MGVGDESPNPGLYTQWKWMSCEGYGLSKSFRWDIPLCIPHWRTYTALPMFLHQKERVQLDQVSCIQYHSQLTTLTSVSTPLSFIRGGLIAFYILFASNVVRGWCKYIVIWCNCDYFFHAPRGYNFLLMLFLNFVSGPKTPFLDFLHYLRHN